MSVFGLLVAVGGLAALGGHLYAHGVADAAHLYALGGLSAFGLVIAALMADPKSVLAFAQSLAAFKWGRRESSTEGESRGEDGR